ncbi:MAG TPA: hypothetical protein VFO51_00670 [Sphingomicrobium sp.]|nr:hypothetical protein [Sphingomicrobium sp.]
MRRILFAAALAATASAPALAQLDTSQGLVNVRIGDVTILDDFLNDTQIAALNNLGVPITVQVPVGVAANVCGVDANVLASQKKAGDATCDATSGSQALAQHTVKQKLGQMK